MPSTVTASLKYFSPPADGSRPWTSINSGAGGRLRNWVDDLRDVEIEDLCGKEDSVSLDTHGFQFVRRAAKHTAFTSDTDVVKEYYPESIELIKELTGASRVVIFDHTIRRRRPGLVDDGPDKRQPAPYVHVDQTAASAIARVHQNLPPTDVPALLARRFQIINLWRPISHPAFDQPLALCDYRTVDTKADLVPTALVYPDREGETMSVRYNANHKWKYVRGMAPDEAVLIKCYDSLDDGSTAILTPHTSFVDPTTPSGTPFRESIEMRFLVFHD